MVTKVTELAIYNVICLCILKYSTNFSFVIIENYALLLTLWLSMLSGFHLGISSWGGEAHRSHGLWPQRGECAPSSANHDVTTCGHQRE